MKLTDFSISLLNGQPLDWSLFAGKKVMLVNTASECGLTPQYEALQELYSHFHDQNFTIIGFPCNDFGAQEPGNAVEIESFCTKNYGVTFPLTEKIQVKGVEAHPIYQWLCETMQTEVTWNFQKFLIDEKGQVFKSLAPTTSPNDPEILDWIQNKTK